MITERELDAELLLARAAALLDPRCEASDCAGRAAVVVLGHCCGQGWVWQRRCRSCMTETCRGGPCVCTGCGERFGSWLRSEVEL